MLRIISGSVLSTVRSACVAQSGRVCAAASVGAVRNSHAGEPDIHGAAFDESYVKFFSQPDIDGWQVRKGMNDLLGMDLVPEPKIISAGLQACRRINDFALAIRWLEGCKDKCGNQKATIYPWLLQEIEPTLRELGINTPEELGYGAPELALKTFD